jgi:predicted permease
MASGIRVSLRQLWKDKAFTLAAVATLAVCIGANVALFSIVDHVLLRPLPWPNAKRIVLMANQYPGAGVGVSSNSGVPDYYDRLRETTVFEQQALYRWDNVSVNQDGAPSRVLVMDVTPSFFGVLGVTAARGRTFTGAEGEIGNEHRAVLSYAFWQSAFGGDPLIVGRDVRLDGQPYTVVGVMPRTFQFLDTEEQVRLWRPLVFTAEQKSDAERHSNSWMNIGALKRDATIRQAQQQIDALNARNLDRFPQYRDLLINARFHTTVISLQDDVVRDVKPTLYLLWGGAPFVLLIGSVNVANLVLVRTSARRHELVTRVVLGASWARIARQLVIENVLLTIASAGAGLFLGWTALRMLGALNMLSLPRALEIRMDTIVAIDTLLVAVAIGVGLGLVALAPLLRANVATVLTEQGRSGTAGRGTRLARRAFVVVQVAFAFLLLVGAGLLLVSFRHVLAVDPGFRPDHVLTAEVTLPQVRYKDAAAVNAFADGVLRRLRALPGAASAGATDSIPFGGNHSDSVILAEGYQMRPGESIISPTQVTVSPGYFESIGATLVRGRFFDDRDNADGPKTIIVDETLARRFWPHQDPIGRRMYHPTDINQLLAITDKTVFMTVVGVVHDLRLANLVEESGEVGTYFYPSPQHMRRQLAFAVRTAAEPLTLGAAMRTTINGLDPALPVYDVRTLSDRMDRSLATKRSAMRLAAAFGIVALLLSAIGVYGVLAYLVVQRTREIGIRLALGSSPAAVFRLVLREGITLVGAGFVVGAAGVAALSRSLASLLYGVDAADPLVLAAVAAMLAAVAIAAGALPASRATRIDPMVALAE